MTPYHILYISRHDSARAPIAAALTRHLSNDQVKAECAGFEPEPVSEHVANFYQHLTGQDLPPSRHINELQQEHYDLIITLCDKSHETVQKLPQDKQHIRWDLPETHTLEGLKRLEVELSERIRLMLLAKGKL